jgi:hypothetical protein
VALLTETCLRHRARPCYSFHCVANYPYDAKRSIQAVISSTRALIQRDPEQETQGIALAVADAAIEAVKAAKPGDPIVQSTAFIYSADQIGGGDPVRAADLLFVAEQLDAALGPYLPALA